MDNLDKINIDGWSYLCPKTTLERKQQLDEYAHLFLIPVLKMYPELFGKVYLALRKNGFFAYKDPVLNIIIPENCMINYDEYRLRFITAHELLHLIQFINGIDSKWNVKFIERQATFLAFNRGFSLDFIKSFPASCQRETCDMKGRFCYYNCSWIFKKSCKLYDESEQIILAQKLANISSKYTIYDDIDYLDVVKKELLQS